MRLFAFICFDSLRVDSLCTKMQGQSIKPTNKEWRRRHSVGNGCAIHTELPFRFNEI